MIITLTDYITIIIIVLKTLKNNFIWMQYFNIYYSYNLLNFVPIYIFIITIRNLIQSQSTIVFLLLATNKII